MNPPHMDRAAERAEDFAMCIGSAGLGFVLGVIAVTSCLAWGAV